MTTPVRTREIVPLPQRALDAHKGSVGRVLVIGGSDGEVMMPGAVALTARAAVRGGAGLVQVMVPASLRQAVIIMCPTVTARSLPDPPNVAGMLAAVEAFRPDVIAIGPGLADSIKPDVLIGFLSSYAGPVVVDADALNTLSRAGTVPGIPSPGRLVMTPHPGEASRLLGVADLESDPQHRRSVAIHLQEMFGAVVVLKGRGTIVTNGDRIFVNETGNPGMATAGVGDVLTGLIAALIGQGLPPFEASILGVHVHGLAGDFAAHDIGQTALTAEDLFSYLPDAFGEVER